MPNRLPKVGPTKPNAGDPALVCRPGPATSHPSRGTLSCAHRFREIHDSRHGAALGERDDGFDIALLPRRRLRS